MASLCYRLLKICHMEKRKYMNGDEWVYCKIYSGELMLEKILIHKVYDVLKNLEDAKLMDKWFFIRYRDLEGSHLRVRFHSTISNNLHKIQDVLKEFFTEMIISKEVSKVVFDTYSREYERYGYSVYPEVEKIFKVDSTAIIGLLSSLSLNEDKETKRWLNALVLVDDTLSAYGLDINKKFLLMKQQRDSFRKEFGFTTIPYIRQLNNKYRESRSLIQQALESDLLSEYADLLLVRKYNIKEIVDKLSSGNRALLVRSLPSMIHMSMNRLFVSSNRLCEMLIYDFLCRYYESLIAQAKYEKK